MQIQFDMPETVTTYFAEKTRSLDVEIGRIPPEMLTMLLAYGLQQKLADGGASIKDADGKLAMAVANLDRIYGGQWGKRGVGSVRAPVDPARNEAFLMAWRTAKARLVKERKLPKNKDEAKAMIKANVTEAMIEGFMEAARMIVEVRDAAMSAVDATDVESIGEPDGQSIGSLADKL